MTMGEDGNTNPPRVWPLIIDIIRGYSANQHAREKQREYEVADRLAFWTKSLAMATWVAAGFAALAAGIFWNQLGTMQAQLNEQQNEQRAWIAVTGIWHNRQKPFAVGEAIDYVIEFKNVGRSPASHMRWYVDNGFYPIKDRTLDVSTATVTQDDMCAKAKIKNGTGVVVPDTDRPVYESGIGFIPPALPVTSTSTDGQKVTVTQAMLDNNAAFYVRGCVAYNTMKIIGATPFCFFVQPYKGVDGSVGNVNSIQCRDEHYLD